MEIKFLKKISSLTLSIFLMSNTLPVTTFAQDNMIENKIITENYNENNEMLINQMVVKLTQNYKKPYFILSCKLSIKIFDIFFFIIITCNSCFKNLFPFIFSLIKYP